jgi:hypothetical protein
VVIAIIAILVGLLLPVLTKAKQKAQTAKCLGNLRQIGVGLHLYVEDFNGLFPPDAASQGTVLPPGQPDYVYSVALGGGDPLPASQIGALLPPAKGRLLASYIPESETFHCPADRGMDFFGKKERPTVFATCGCSYRFNAGLEGDYTGIAEDPDHNLALKSETWVTDPARFIMLHECGPFPVVEGDNTVQVAP